MAFIYYLSDQPGNLPEEEQMDWFRKLKEIFDFENADKAVHLILFLVLGVFIFNGLPWPIPILIGFGSLYALSDEFHQRFVPGRTFDYYDLLFDVIGLTIGIFALSKLKTKRLRSGFA